MAQRQQKITLGEMREMGIRGVLVYCSNFHCSHWIAISGDRWADHIGLSDLEPGFVCRVCGTKGANLRPNFHWKQEHRRNSAVSTTADAWGNSSPRKRTDAQALHR